MKNIITAVQNDELIKKLSKMGKYIVYEQDIGNAENVLEYISKYKPDIIITKDNISKKMTKEIYLKQIRLISPTIKIIVITEELSLEYKSFLFSQEIFNIIESPKARFETIFGMLESSNKQVVYKSENTNKLELSQDFNIFTKQTVAVFGTSGSGKSYIASLLGQIFSKKINLNTLLVDMDIQNPALDIYNNLDARTNILDMVMEDIDKDQFIKGSLSDSCIRSKTNGKLSFITNNIGIYECQNKINNQHYEMIYNDVLNNYDVTVFDLPSSPFLDVVSYMLLKVNKIFFVVNPNFISIRQAVKYLELLENIWKIKKENIYIVINKYTNESLSEKQILAILKDYNVILKVGYQIEIEEIINGIRDINTDSVEKLEGIYKMFNLNIEVRDNLRSNKDLLYKRISQKIGAKL